MVQIEREASHFKHHTVASLTPEGVGIGVMQVVFPCRANGSVKIQYILGTSTLVGLLNIT